MTLRFLEVLQFLGLPFLIGQLITRRIHNPLFGVFLFFRILFLLFGF
jgi:hypothetical protein